MATPTTTVWVDPYEFVEAGEPAAASFRIATYDGGDTPNLDLDEYVFAS